MSRVPPGGAQFVQQPGPGGVNVQRAGNANNSGAGGPAQNNAHRPTSPGNSAPGPGQIHKKDLINEASEMFSKRLKNLEGSTGAFFNTLSNYPNFLKQSNTDPRKREVARVAMTRSVEDVNKACDDMYQQLLIARRTLEQLDPVSAAEFEKKLAEFMSSNAQTGGASDGR